MQLDRIAAYWDLRADGYSATIHEELAGAAGETFRSALRAAMPKGERLDCLDMGCGPGFFTLLLNADGHNVTSADYSPDMLERTRRNCAEAGFEARTVRADAQALPFADDSFDFICSRNLVWNLEDPERAYREWLRVLRPGGHMFVFDGNYYLHYTDAAYQAAREAAAGGNRPGGHSTKGVDPAPIDEIARTLPLSSKARPDWDEETLARIGFEDIRAERFMEDYTDPRTGKPGSIVRDFTIVCAKGARA